jgi:serine/threonine-protein kinase RsbW
MTASTGSAFTTGASLCGGPAMWWSRDFTGGADQVPEVRRWIADLLPDCDPLADLLLLASELSANAVMHTRSGQAGGWFSVAVEWTPALARVVVGDQGSLSMPTAAAKTGTAAGDEESGRGLWLVNELADDWGTVSRPGGRWVRTPSGSGKAPARRRAWMTSPLEYPMIRAAPAASTSSSGSPPRLI